MLDPASGIRRPTHSKASGSFLEGGEDNFDGFAVFPRIGITFPGPTLEVAAYH